MPGELAPGVYLQIYRGAVPGKTPQKRLDWCKQKLDTVQGLVAGIAWHGFVGDLGPRRFAQLSGLCHERGMASLAAYGLGQDSNRGPKRAAEWMARVAAMPECAGLILDAEGRWEDDGKAVEATRTKILCQTLRSLAPNALVIDQPWPVPTLHWSQFAWEEWSKCVDYHAPQYYVNNFKNRWGKERYARCISWFFRSWHTLERKRLAPLDLVKPRIATIQAYGWEDIPTDLDACLRVNPTLIAWCDPWPTQDFMEALQRR